MPLAPSSRQLRRPRGFTLLELIVVVVILGVLAAVAIPTYNAVTSEADATAAHQEQMAIVREAQALMAFGDLEWFEAMALVANDLTAAPAPTAGVFAAGEVWELVPDPSALAANPALSSTVAGPGELLWAVTPGGTLVTAIAEGCFARSSASAVDGWCDTAAPATTEQAAAGPDLGPISEPDPEPEPEPTYADAVLAAEPVAYWQLNETSGTSAADASGNGHTATYASQLGRGVVGPVAEDGNTAITKDPGAGSVGISVSTLPKSETVTWAWWFRGPVNGLQYGNAGPARWVGDGSGGAGYRMDKRGVNDLSSLGLRIDTGAVSPNANQTRFVPSGQNVWDDDWHHIAMVLDNGTVNIYVDGTVVTSSTYNVGNGLVAGVPDLATVQSTYAGVSFDEVAYFDYALSPEQVATLHAAAS